MVSFSPALQGLLVNLNPEYEITNDAIAFASGFAEHLLATVTKEAKSYANKNQVGDGKITPVEIEQALRKAMSAELAGQAVSEGASALSDYQAQLKEDTMRETISEFEVIEGEDNSKEGEEDVDKSPIERRSKESIWFSPELVLKFLLQEGLIRDEQNIDKSATIFLSSSLEYVISRLLDVVGRKSNPTLIKQAFESVFEEGEVFYGMWGTEKLDVVGVVPKGDLHASDNENVSGRGEPLLGSMGSNVDVPTTSAEDARSSPVTSRAPSPPPQHSQSDEYLRTEPLLDMRMFFAPLLLVLGRACKGFEITSRGMQIFSSLAEYLLRSVVVESSCAAHTVSNTQVQAAVFRLLPEDSAHEAIRCAEENADYAFHGRELLLVHSAAELVHPAWNASFADGTDRYIANVTLYIVKQTLVFASTHARSTGVWVIRGDDIVKAAASIISVTSPIWKAVVAARDRSASEIAPLLEFVSSLSPLYSKEEGRLLSPPSPPRTTAAEKIYFTSIIHDPLQTDNQLLIMFLFLATLSLRTIIVA